MARWISQNLNINARAQINLEAQFVTVGDLKNGPAVFMPETRDEAEGMAISLRLAAKRLEEIGKGMS